MEFSNIVSTTYSESTLKEFTFDKVIPYRIGAYEEAHLNQSAESYLSDLKGIFKHLSKDITIPISLGDCIIPKSEHGFAKARRIGSDNTSILKLNKKRHWNYNLGLDIDWNDKLNSVIWRGATTGGSERLDFVNKYKDHFNIGFSNLTKNLAPQTSLYESLIKGRTTIAEQLNYKFIVSLEGNDVATNLKWILHSNSVPIMKKPKYESWLMEGLLKPYVHYLPLNDDASNLNEILIWAKKNDRDCKEIALNGKEYMTMFMDNDREIRIQKILIQKYHRNTI